MYRHGSLFITRSHNDKACVLNGFAKLSLRV